MIKPPLVSIVLPVYNCEKYIESAISSIISQTYTNWELLIIYDKSDDKSLDIINSMIELDRRLNLIYNPSKGLISALNHGIKLAKGDYIARMDADDISLPKRIELQIKHMYNNELDVCGSHHFIIDKNGEDQGFSYVPLTHEDCFIRLLSAVPFAHPSVIIKKEFLEINNLYYGINTDKLAEDLDMWINMFNHSAKFGNVDQFLIKYRILKTSLSRQNKNQLMKQSLKFYSSFFKKNINRISEILNKKLDFKNNTDKYYYSRMAIKYVLNRYDLKTIKKLHKVDFIIIFKALVVEIKNHAHIKLYNLIK